ncbi:MAG: CBS domain-containing protein [Polyangiaceae bacterium]
MSKKPLHKTVGDLMSREIISMRETDRAAAALREMKVSAIRHLPIVDAEDRLVGIVSASDLVASAGRTDDPEIRTIMTRDVHTVRADMPAERAVATMIDQKFNSIPVVGPGGVLVGILTATDFLVVAYQALTGAPIVRETGEL